MKGRLSDGQIEYVLEHLGHHAVWDPAIGDRIFYGSAQDDSPAIIFHASEEALDPDKVMRIREIPVLYPGTGSADRFWSLRKKRLEFHHDLLKSAFHLLSGYEEVKNGVLDQYGRFPYEESIQYKLGIIHTPVVNYYFEIILEAMERYARQVDLPFERKPRLPGPVLMLSHDIDRVKGYGFFETGFRFKQWLGLAGRTMDKKAHAREALKSLVHFMNPFSSADPHWTFEKMMQWEQERSISATYFFLEREGGRNENSRYRFSEKKFSSLFRQITEQGHEIGIHGTLSSATSDRSMKRTVQHLAEASPQPVEGIRQHYLKFTPGKTARIQAAAGLRYDASLGFAEMDGFRRSYCWPYKFYDFEARSTLDHWEIPLTVMEGTHFYYRKLNLEEGFSSFSRLASEVQKFNGVFSLLWHNHFFDEKEVPGITEHYLNILDHLTGNSFRGITGKGIFQLMIR